MIILRNIENIGSDLLAIGDTTLSGLMSWILNFELPTVEKIIYISQLWSSFQKYLKRSVYVKINHLLLDLVTILNIFLISIYTSKLMKGNFQQHFKQVDAVVCCMFQFSSPLQKRRAWFYVQTKDSCNVCLWYMCRYCTSKSRRWMFFLWILH